MEIKRKLSNSETNTRDQLLDCIQIKLQCVFNLNYSLEQAIYANIWGTKQKFIRIIKIIEGSIIHDNFKSFTELSIQNHMSSGRVSVLLHKVDRVLRKFILDKYTSKCRSLGIEMIIDIDDYINLIGGKVASFMYLNAIKYAYREIPNDPYDSSWWTAERLKNELEYRKANGLPIEYPDDLDDYINLIAKKDTSLKYPYRELPSDSHDYDGDPLRPNELPNKLQEGL